MRMQGKCIVGVVLIVHVAQAVPPYMWYATHSIENYSGNGCDYGLNLQRTHEEADGFNAAIQGRSLPNAWYRYNRRNEECTAERWTGEYAEINMVDFLFFSGHGCGTGPYLGCDPAYELTNWTDIRFGGNGYLKWVQGSACSWFIAAVADKCESGKEPFERWANCFAGVHAIMGHRAVTYEYINEVQISAEFWERWVDTGNSVYTAWREAQAHWVYEEAGYPGLQPATAAPSFTYISELWADAGDAPAPSGIGYLGWTTFGTPEY